jgi:hypothetical protein
VLQLRQRSTQLSANLLEIPRFSSFANLQQLQVQVLQLLQC